jgi:hypothetical protein
LGPALVHIAGYALCRNKRNKHQEQSANIVQTWKTKILRAYPNGVVEIADTAPEAATPLSTTPSSGPPSRPSPVLDDMGLARPHLFGRVHEDLGLSSHSASREPSVAPIPTTEVPHPASSSAQTSQTVLSTPLYHDAGSTRLHSPDARLEHYGTPCPLNLTHVPRRSPDLECLICLGDASDTSALTWCKAGCGRSMHKECVELWRESRRGQWFVNDGNTDTMFRCAHCRTEWVDCDCER